MDGVLVDTSQSYRTVVVETLQRLLAQEKPPALPQPTTEWVAALKQVGGFNNDWDLTRALLRGVLSKGVDFDVHRYATGLRQLGGGVDAVDALLGAAPTHPALRPDPLADDGVKRLFQEIYLGETLFQSIYASRRTLVEGDGSGFIDRETPLFSVHQLRTIAQAPLAVATGRPSEEARYTLKRFDFLPIFDALVTHDDVVAADAVGKPNPWILEETRRRLELPAKSRCAYVGDLPDDMHAAQGAGFIPIGFRASKSADGGSLEDAGAIGVASDPDELISLLKSL